MEKLKFVPPCVFSSVDVEMETAILAGSVAAVMGAVETTGHEVQNYDWTNDQSFNHVWE